MKSKEKIYIYINGIYRGERFYQVFSAYAQKPCEETRKALLEVVCLAYKECDRFKDFEDEHFKNDVKLMKKNLDEMGIEVIDERDTSVISSLGIGAVRMFNDMCKNEWR